MIVTHPILGYQKNILDDDVEKWVAAGWRCDEIEQQPTNDDALQADWDQLNAAFKKAPSRPSTLSPAPEE